MVSRLVTHPWGVRIKAITLLQAHPTTLRAILGMGKSWLPLVTEAFTVEQWGPATLDGQPRESISSAQPKTWKVSCKAYTPALQTGLKCNCNGGTTPEIFSFIKHTKSTGKCVVRCFFFFSMGCEKSRNEWIHVPLQYNIFLHHRVGLERVKI